MFCLFSVILQVVTWGSENIYPKYNLFGTTHNERLYPIFYFFVLKNTFQGLQTLCIFYFPLGALLACRFLFNRSVNFQVFFEFKRREKGTGPTGTRHGKSNVQFLFCYAIILCLI